MEGVRQLRSRTAVWSNPLILPFALGVGIGTWMSWDRKDSLSRGGEIPLSFGLPTIYLRCARQDKPFPVDIMTWFMTNAGNGHGSDEEQQQPETDPILSKDNLPDGGDRCAERTKKPGIKWSARRKGFMLSYFGTQRRIRRPMESSGS